MKTWSRLGLVLLSCAVATACAKGEQASSDASVGNSPDATIFVDPPDAALNQPDAPPGQPDAAPGTPDAAPGTPDAAPGTPDATPIPDATPPTPDATPPPPDAGCTDVIVQLFSNENFDLGPGGGWNEVSAFDLINPTAALPAAVIPQSGGYAVWLGGAFDSIDLMYQDVAIPAGATNMSVAGYQWIGTEELSGTWDFIDITLNTTSDVLLETLASWSNANNGTTWTPFNLIPAGSYAGQTVRFTMRSTTDSTLNTNFFFDTFALRVTVCQ